MAKRSVRSNTADAAGDVHQRELCMDQENSETGGPQSPPVGMDKQTNTVEGEDERVVAAHEDTDGPLPGGSIRWKPDSRACAVLSHFREALQQIEP